MKKIVALVITLSFFITNQAIDSILEKLLAENEQRIDQRYYELLAHVEDTNADITFIRSREPENMSLEASFLKMVARATKAEIIVETGTYKCQSTKKMATKFKQVHSIELGKELYEQAQKICADKKNIFLYHGDSAQVLPSILPKLKGKTVFFLDAHFSMHDTACGSQNTPILTELEIIKKAKIKNSIIIIDDMRMFYKPITNVRNTFMDGYPDAHDLVEALLAINPTYQIALVYDTLIAFPAADNITVSPLVKAVTMSRLYNNENYAIDDILAAELCIAKAEGQEQEVLADLCQRWVEPWSKTAGLSRHYALWYGLMLINHEEYGKAYAYFEEAKKRGVLHWRIDWYMTMAQATCFFEIRS